MPAAADMLEKIAGGIAVEGMESLAPVLVDAMVPVRGPAARRLASPWSWSPRSVRARAHDLAATNEEFLAAAWSTASDGGAAPLDLSRPRRVPPPWTPANFATLADTRAAALAPRVSWWSVTSLGRTRSCCRRSTAIRCDAREPRGYQGDVAEMMEFIGSRVQDELARGGRHRRARPGPAPRRALPRRRHPLRTGWTRWSSHRSRGIIEITTARRRPRLRRSTGCKLGLLTEADLLGRSSAYAAKRGTRSWPRGGATPSTPCSWPRATSWCTSSTESPVRRADPAQGRHRRRATRAMREYMVLEYAPSKRGAPGDRLFVPTDQLDQVTRYVGGETPALSKMGGADWSSTKSKARKAVKEIAGELIRLYSARMASRGHAFQQGHALAARAGGGVPVRRDPRPADHHQRGQGGHGARDPDGPAGLRRRRLRQDGDRRPGRVQGRAGRQAGGRAGAHHAAGPPAPRDVHRAVLRLPGAGALALPVPDRQGGQGRHRGAEERVGGRRGRHPPAAVQGGRSSRTWGWWSSTRSSASASSTRKR